MFPLLTLPYCAINKVLDLLDSNELLILSICSKRTCQLIKNINCVPKKVKLEIIVFAMDALSFETHTGRYLLVKVFEISEMPKDKTLEKGKIGNSIVSMEMGRVGCLKTYWNDRKFGIKEVVTYGMEVFGKPIECLAMSAQRSNDEPIWILDWINSFQKPLFKCYCSSNGEMSDENITYFLKNCTVTGKFMINFKPSDQLFWIHTDTTQMNYDEILDGIEVNQSDTHLVREYVLRDTRRLSIRGRLDIKKRNEEVTATILRNHVESTQFMMVVWPDSRNDP
uniref:F-box domain-containing protein n=1 Tax=Caenorhabditis tropicalis TaxID=1561998 RepID=A0A1I7T2X9_9PELO